MKNLDKIMFGAAGLAAAAGAVGAETPKVDSTQEAKAAHVSEFHGETTKVQKDANGAEYVIIDGKKFIMAPADSVYKSAETKAKAKDLKVSGEMVTPGSSSGATEMAEDQ